MPKCCLIFPHSPGRLLTVWCQTPCTAAWSPEPLVPAKPQSRYRVQLLSLITLLLRKEYLIAQQIDRWSWGKQITSWANWPRPDCFSCLFNKIESLLFYLIILFCLGASGKLNCKLQPWRGEAFSKTNPKTSSVLRDQDMKKLKWKSAKNTAAVRPALQEACRSSATLQREREICHHRRVWKAKAPSAILSS